MSTPCISVIMSIYKEPTEWIRQSIDSILGQSFRDFEFIIVNDNPSREENNLLLDEYMRKDSRIIVITNETNLGLTKSLNRALMKARGEFIARMDADDISSLNRFEKQVAFLKDHPSLIAVGCWVIPIDESGKQFEQIVRYETNPRWVRAQFIQNSQVCHPASMFRRVNEDLAVQYDESMRFAQDYALWVSLLPYGDITNIPEALLSLRSSHQQITSSKREEQRACAERVQARAFSLFDFPSDDAFLKLFSVLTIHHGTDFQVEDVTALFKRFFADVRLTRQNSLALEIVYSTYLGFMRSKSGGSLNKFFRDTFNGSSPFMLRTGCRLGFHLLGRKLSRVI